MAIRNGGSPAFFHREKLRLDRLVGDYRRNTLVHFIQLPAQTIRKKNERFREADVTDLALLIQSVELRFAHAGNALALQRLASRARVHNTQHPHGINSLAGQRQQQRQRIHDQAGIYAGADHGNLTLDAKIVEFTGNGLMTIIWKQGLFARGHTVQSTPDDFSKLFVSLKET